VSLGTVALVFTDLVGSTELANRIGPGPADALRREHFTILRDAAAQSGGREVKNLGDGLMLAFASASAAVDAAVRIQQAIAARNLQALQRFEVRIGIAIGEVTEEDDDYFGEPVVQAARLCALADGGQVLVTDLVRVLAGASPHAFRPVGDLQLKGLPDAVTTHEAAWVPMSGAALPLPPRLRGAPESTYVGRTVEQARLDAAWEAAVGGAAQLVLLAGEPGIGKTRLSTHHAMAVHETGGTVLYGAVDEGVGIPYQPWIEALDHYVAHAPQPLLDRYVAEAGGSAGRLLPNLARRVADLPAPSSSDGETERYLMLEATTRLVAAAAADNPVLVVLDDVHWADTPTLHLLAHLHRSLADSRVLFVATYRDSELTPEHALTDALATMRRNEERIRRIVLHGLDEAELVEFLRNVSGQETTEDARTLAALLERDTNGNPLFVAEVLRDLLEGGYLELDERGVWGLADGVDRLPAPQSVRDVVAQRVGRLGAETARVLATAAVIGRDFELDLLAAVLEVELDDLLESIDAAMAASLLTESGARAGSLRFVHALIAQALVDGLTSVRRNQLHRRIAAGIELLHGPDLGERVGVVARHLVAAGEAPEKTVDYARRAGQHAIVALAPDEAMRWFRIAIALLGDSGSADELLRCELMADLGEAMRDAGDPGARDELIAAAHLARRLGDGDGVARSVLALIRPFAVSVGETDEDLIAGLEAALTMRPAHDGTRARLLAMLAAEVNLYASPERRRELVEEAMTIARSLDDATLARVLVSSLIAHWGPALRAERKAILAELEQLVDRIGDAQVLAIAAIHGVWISLETLDRAGFEYWFGHVVAIDSSAQPAARWCRLIVESQVALLRGDLQSAERIRDEAFAFGTEVGIRDLSLAYATQVGDSFTAQGRFGELGPVLDGLGSPNVLAVQVGRAWAHMDAGDAETALTLFDRVLETDLEALPDSQQWSTAMSILARTANRAHRRDAAERLYRLALQAPDILVTNGGSVGTHMSTELGMLASTLERRDDAVAHFEFAERALEEFGAPILLARNRYEHARALHELGDPADRGAARELVELSLAEYRRLGFPVRIAQCEELQAQLG
jgi:tetratricopeptide (TPR) repeat protein